MELRGANQERRAGVRYTATFLAFLFVAAGSIQCGDDGGILGTREAGGDCILSTPNLVSNGGFETPPIAGAPYASPGEGDSIGAWLVESGAVDLVTDAYWRPASGAQSLDLDGSCGVGTITQAIAPDSGHTYQICFAIAGNPDGPPDLKPVEIWWGGARVDSFVVDATLSRRENLRWTTRQYVVTAPASLVTLQFRSATPGCYGPVVDDVIVQEITVPIP